MLSTVPTIEQVRLALIERPRGLSYKDICKATGVSIAFVKHLACGWSKNPSYNQTALVYNFIVKEQEKAASKPVAVESEV